MANILIVDDSSFARANLRRILGEPGYQITEVASGQLAIDAVRTQAPDLVTLDLLMPGLSGLETLIQMRPICPQTKFLVISADIQTTTREELIAAGAEAFLNKPVSRADLLATVAQLIGSA
jgi:CheY-like chemotaxis protein